MTLVERLRDAHRRVLGTEIYKDAADEIERLEKALETAREDALQEAIEIASSITAPKSIGRDHGRHHEAGAQRAARAIRTLSQKKEG